MRLLLIFLSLFFFSISMVKAQDSFVNEEPAVTNLVKKFIEWNKDKNYVIGWRIQIINTDDRRKMERAMSKFRSKFPYISNVVWEQVNPYYRVKVGGFNSKLKAQAFLDEVKEYFPSAITVWEKIRESEFIERVD